MICKKIKYIDYTGVERIEEHWFNLSRAEVIEMNYDIDGGLEATYRRIVDAKDEGTLIKIFKDLVLKSHGVICDDGRRFKKTEEDRLAFSQTEAYVELFMELARDEKAAIEFFNGIVPKVDGNVKTLPASN